MFIKQKVGKESYHISRLIAFPNNSMYLWVCVFIPHTCFASRRHSSPLKSAKSCSAKMPPHFSPPPFCCFFIISLTFLPPPLFGHQRRLFQWLPSNQMSLKENWLAETPPCAGDSVRMGIEESADQGIELALLSGKLRVSELVLPENGILYFGDRAELGSKQRALDWQCSARPSGPQDALFRPKLATGPNFYDAASWRIINGGSNSNVDPGTSQSSLLEKEGGGGGIGGGGARARGGGRASSSGAVGDAQLLFLLDAERVPSTEDDVSFPAESVSKVSINAPAKVHSFLFAGNPISNEQLRGLPFSVEGQFWLRIGSPLSAEFQLGNRYQFRWPLAPVISLIPEPNERAGKKAAFFGRPNGNFFEPQFSALCQFVRCQPVDSYCAEPVKPVGQCCDQCGAMLRFRQNSLNFTHSLAIAHTLVALQLELDDWLSPVGAGLSLARIDRDDFHPLYQLAVLSPNPADYSETRFCDLLWTAFRRIQQRGINAHLPVDYEPSNVQQNYFDLRSRCSRQKSLWHLSEVMRLLFPILAIGTILGFAFRAEYRRNARLRLFIANLRPNAQQRIWQSLPVRWRSSAFERVDIGDGEPAAVDDATNQSAAAGFRWAEFVNRAFLWGRPSIDAGCQAEMPPTAEEEKAKEDEEEEGQEEDVAEGNEKKEEEQMLIQM